MAKTKINNLYDVGYWNRTQDKLVEGNWLFLFCFFFIKVDFQELAMTTLLDHSMSSNMMY